MGKSKLLENTQRFRETPKSQMGVIKYFWCVLLKNNSRISPEFKADSELEAIIKACEFILTKRNQNENKQRASK